MENIVNLLLDNFIYIIFAGIILMLALIGYVVDAGREEKIRKKIKSENEKVSDIPNIDPNIKISETINGNNSIDLSKNSKDIPEISPVKMASDNKNTIEEKTVEESSNKEKNVK